MKVVRRFATTKLALPKPTKPLLVVVGATGTGKSQLAVDLALRFNGEVINGDAMQLYQGLPIITNQIKQEERRGVKHHLLGCVNVSEPPWTVQDFVRHATKVVSDIHGKGKMPVLVGGTHYYLQSLLFEDAVVVRNDDCSGRVEASELSVEARTKLDGPTSEMLAELRRVDPIMASRWHPNDRRKIRRSLEIFFQSGRKASDIYAEQQRLETSLTTGQSGKCGPDTSLRYPTLIFWTHTAKEELDTRLDRRVDSMLEDGLLDEVKCLEEARLQIEAATDDVDFTKGIWVAIGYKEFRSVVADLSKDSSEEALHSATAEALELTKTATRQYSRSQIKWIRIKLVRAIGGAESRRVRLIDTSDPSRWQSEIFEPVADLAQRFLAGESLPTLMDSSPIATEIFAAKVGDIQSWRNRPWQTHTCELCNVTAATERQWEQHLSSRRHRNTLKAKTKHPKNHRPESFEPP